MDIASIYVKNMLWSLSFVTATQAKCVHCSERKNLLFVRDLAPHQCLLCRKASAAIAWGRFMHWVHVQRALWRGSKEGNLCFLLLSSNTREHSHVVWFFSKVFCWHPGNQESKPQLGWDPHPLARWIFRCRGADLNEELGISSEVAEVYWLLETVLLPGRCRMYEMWHRGCMKDHTFICEV